MSSTSPVVLILGAGPNIGQHAADEFAAKGYKTALVSRSLTQNEKKDNQINIVGDLANPDSVPGIFSEVERTLGSPSVVIYNGEF